MAIKIPWNFNWGEDSLVQAISYSKSGLRIIDVNQTLEYEN